jgi:D-3-phosphoglycerate dehydrogenase
MIEAMSTSAAPFALLVDGRYRDYDLERNALARVGVEFRESGRLPTTEEEVLATPGLADASVLLVELSPITRAVLESASGARAVIRYGTGSDNIDVDAAAELGIEVENIPGYAAESVSEHAMALLLAVARRLPAHLDRVRSGGWRDGDPDLRPTGLVGSTIGILGMGAIGRALAVRARAFGMNVLGHDPIADDPEVHRLADMVTMGEVIAGSDYLSLHLPLLPDTRHLIDAETLSQVKRGVVIINTARGGLVDEKALLDALDTGLVSFAALDVAETEPLPADHPFRRHERVLMTPHTAFWSDQAEFALRTAVASKAAAHFEKGNAHDKR